MLKGKNQKSFAGIKSTSRKAGSSIITRPEYSRFLVKHRWGRFHLSTLLSRSGQYRSWQNKEYILFQVVLVNHPTPKDRGIHAAERIGGG